MRNMLKKQIHVSMNLFLPYIIYVFNFLMTFVQYRKAFG